MFVALAAFAVSASAEPKEVEVVNNPVREPIHLVQQTAIGVGVIISEPLQIFNAGEDYVVPDGKQLVIEFVSLETVGYVLAALEIYQGMILVPPEGGRYLVGTVTGERDVGDFGADSGEQVLIRVPEGKTVSIGLRGNFTNLVNVDVSGYLEDM